MFEHFLVWVIRGTQTLFLIFAGLFCLKLQLGRTPLLRPLIVFVTPEPCLALAFQPLSLGVARCELRPAGDPQISRNTSTRTSAKQRAAYLNYRRAVPRKQRRLCDGFVGDRAPVLTIRFGRNDCGQRDTFSVKNFHNKTIHYGRLFSDRYLFLSKSLYSLNVLIYDTRKMLNSDSASAVNQNPQCLRSFFSTFISTRHPTTTTGATLRGIGFSISKLSLLTKIRQLYSSRCALRPVKYVRPFHLVILDQTPGP